MSAGGMDLPSPSVEKRDTDKRIFVNRSLSLEKIKVILSFAKHKRIIQSLIETLRNIRKLYIVYYKVYGSYWPKIRLTLLFFDKEKISSGWICIYHNYMFSFMALIWTIPWPSTNPLSMRFLVSKWSGRSFYN